MSRMQGERTDGMSERVTVDSVGDWRAHALVVNSAQQSKSCQLSVEQAGDKTLEPSFSDPVASMSTAYCCRNLHACGRETRASMRHEPFLAGLRPQRASSPQILQGKKPRWIQMEAAGRVRTGVVTRCAPFATLQAGAFLSAGSAPLLSATANQHPRP